MPSLVRAHKFKDNQVIQELTRLQNSRFFGATQEWLTDHITIGEARRYLYYLIVINAKESSDLPSIAEVGSRSPSNQESDVKKFEDVLRFVHRDIFNENFSHE